ncbi:hypothetical protein NP493_584g00011 [Ridgeia piscesae]|uniref:THAP-type domain-containing protein n=1 Tax=Ridgeia piscesae TaxID=27915 RepID=A0AAD9NPF3_RIDPI|nr:hypothetical protein NP493_584g00011 [Ridgeia piscesae]
MPECQAYGCQHRAGEGATKGKRFFQIPNAKKFPAKRELAMKWLHNIGTGHTVEKFNFNRKMVCEDHFTVDSFKVDLENRLLRLVERRLLKEDAVPTEFVHRTKSPGPIGAMAREERSRKRDEQKIVRHLLSPAPGIAEIDYGTNEGDHQYQDTPKKPCALVDKYVTVESTASQTDPVLVLPLSHPGNSSDAPMYGNPQLLASDHPYAATPMMNTIPIVESLVLSDNQTSSRLTLLPMAVDDMSAGEPMTPDAHHTFFDDELSDPMYVPHVSDIQIGDNTILKPLCSHTVYDEVQTKYLVPVVHSTWMEEQQRMVQLLKSRESVALIGDGRCDSPGYCAKYCGDPDLLVEKWKSILYHACNIHEWPDDPEYKMIHKCDHAPLDPHTQRKKKWIEVDSDLHEALRKVVTKKQFLRDIRMLARFMHTGALEVYHALITKYAPKRQHFAYPQMLARTALAALDHNSNVGRSQARVRKPNAQSTEEGDLMYRCAFSKQTKQWVAKPIYTEKKYDYIKPMMEAAVQRKLSGEEGPTYTPAVPNIAPCLHQQNVN